MKIKGTVTNTQDGRSAIDVLEEALCALRVFPDTLLVYYIGSLPFVLGFLYFWADMSQNAYGGHDITGASFCITLLFVWMKCCQVVFAENIYNRISGETIPKRGLRDYFHLCSTQTAIHCTGFFIWPIALLLTLPFGWAFAFYHYSTIVQDNPYDIKTVSKKSSAYANHWPQQNNILILLFALLYILGFINICAALFIIPQLFKIFFAIDSAFVLSGAHLFNTTFLTIAFSLTYLCINPVVKTAYVIRYFEGNSIRFGNDIKIDLQFLKSHSQSVLMAVIIILASTSCLWASGTVSAGQVKVHQSISLESLNNSIDQVLSEREFAWRMPHVEAVEGDKKVVKNTSTQWLYDQIEKMRLGAIKLLKKAWKWLKKHFSHEDSKAPVNSKVKLLKISKELYILVSLMIVVLGIVFFAIWRLKKKNIIIEEKPASIPDITSETIRADDLLTDEWRNLANNLLNKGDLRHAVRAFYLGTLSQLARVQLITIKQYKSNYDYEIEVKRRAREKHELVGNFAQSSVFLNSVWYGNRSLNIQEVLDFARKQEEIIQLANV